MVVCFIGGSSVATFGYFYVVEANVRCIAHRAIHDSILTASGVHIYAVFSL